MKVFQIVPRFSIGGAEIMAENLMYGLSNFGCEVTAVSFYDYKSDITERLDKHNIPIQFVGKNRGLDIRLIFRLYKLFKKHKPDVVHTHIGAIQYTIPAAILSGIPVRIHTVHSVAEKETGKINKRINKLYFKLFHTIPVALSDLIQNGISKLYAISQDKIPVVFNGMSLEKYVPKSNYVFNSKINIAHIGRFEEAKNHVGLINAFEIVHKKHPETILNLYGDGRLIDDIRRIVAKKGLEDSVNFHGIIDDVAGALSENDIFCLPSNYEGIPMTLIEAMASAMPIVATAVGGVPDMLTDGQNALLCKNSIDEIANSLNKLIESEDLRSRLGQNAVIRSKQFSASVMSSKYLELYKNQNK